MDYSVAIVGATGLVGRKMLEILEKRDFPVKEITLFAGERSKGQTLSFRGQDIEVLKLTPENVTKKHFDIALFSAGSEVAYEYAPIFVDLGATVIDNSSAFRMCVNVPLVVPEVNESALITHRGIIANPNCSTIQAVVAIAPIHKKYALKRIIYSTYQSVSGAGYKGLNDLEAGTTKAFLHPIKDNIIPQIDDFGQAGYTKEELKMINETRKILDCSSLRVTATAVRIPITYCHGVTVNLETEKSFSISDVKKLLACADGVTLLDAPENHIYPTPLIARGTGDVYIGRLRRDDSAKNALSMFTLADNLYKGASLNAVQIAEALIKNNAVRATEQLDLGD